MFGLIFSKNARNSTLFAQKDQKSGNRGRNFDLKTDYKQSLWFISVAEYKKKIPNCYVLKGRNGNAIYLVHCKSFDCPQSNKLQCTL